MSRESDEVGAEGTGGIGDAIVDLPGTVRLLRRERESRILFTLHAEWILLLGAVFLPVAATARLIPAANEENGLETLAVFGLLAVPILLSMIVFTICFNYKRKKYHVHRHPNS